MFRQLLLKLKLAEPTLEEVVANNQKLGRKMDAIATKRRQLKQLETQKILERHGQL